jgi:uncharacterized membrane protein
MQVIDVPASAGITWIKLSFALFRAQPIGWMSLVFAWLLTSFVLFFVPLIGGAVATILQPGFFASFVLAARDQEMGKPLGIHQLFAAFRANGRQLVAIGSITLLADLMVIAILGILGFPYSIPVDANGMPDMRTYMQLMDGKQWMLVLYFAMMITINGALWFTSAILALNQMPATHAIRWSCYALIANFFPMSVFGVAMMTIFMLAALPFFLGLLVAMPIYAIAHYVSYRDLFRPTADA